jgi:2-oxoglutarate ferredoxin oxidoreductase subunit alpha
MSEYLGLAYYTETPVVVWNVQRTGPSTGLPTRTSQGDLTQAYFNSHGDKDFIILIPGSVNECFEFGWRAFDIAERFQTPVLVLTDLDFGMNIWMTPAFTYPDQPMDRGKVLWEKDLDAFIQQHGQWGRYQDVDGDGIPYRTVMGNTHPQSAYFTRGTGHDEFARYSEEPDVWERGMDRLKRKFETARQVLPKPTLTEGKNSAFGVISMGSSDPAVGEALYELEQSGISADYLRIRAIPFADEVRKFLSRFENIYVVETNRDGQLLQLLTIAFPQQAARLRKVSHLDGLPLTAKWVRETILSQERKND